MDYILGGLRFKTKQILDSAEHILVEMIKDKQVVDSFRLPTDLTPHETVQRISFIVLSSYPALSNTTGFSLNS
tara:strand:+ start:552 stop:770 length:219 start_codon:yes stop_codon:yes gene_type:complete